MTDRRCRLANWRTRGPRRSRLGCTGGRSVGLRASTALGNAVLAPLSALSATDVVLETNIESAIEGGKLNLRRSGGELDDTGPPTHPGVSVASTAGASVYTAFNPRPHCLGALILSRVPPTRCSERLCQGNTTSGWSDDCGQLHGEHVHDESTVPAGWATGDPLHRWRAPE